MDFLKTKRGKYPARYMETRSGQKIFKCTRLYLPKKNIPVIS
jgi:hypothetical protein